MAEVNFDALRCCSLFYSLSDESLKELIPAFEDITLTDGQYLFEEGVPGDAFYIVMGGGVRLTKNLGESNSLTVAELGTGDVFGEMSLLSNASRSTACLCLDNAKLWKLSRQNFEDLETSALTAYSAVLKNLSTLLCQRLSGATVKVASLIDSLSEAETRKTDMAERVKMNRTGLLGFIESLGT